ncbi:MULTISPECIES: alanine racemase [unclassified Nocardioides]|uniref:alanine racemase n=1 Tax=unclassified Nocardioides TaxID=2615069 RepID=UPI003014E376
MLPAARAEIVVDLAAIRHNVQVLRELAGVPVMTVVKADGYGHGMVPVARAAREAGAEWLGVATLDEALELRASGDTGRILCWLYVPGEEYDAGVAAGLDLTAYTPAELDEIEESVGDTGRTALVQLKIDTGLSRGGASPASWPALIERAREGERAGHWKVTGIWSHFSSSDEPDDPANDAQEASFRWALTVAEAAGLRPEVRHLANSAATLLRPSSRFDLVRCGIASYGLDPAPGETSGVDLRPAMTARASLALVKDVEAGDAVSYGRTWIAETPTTIGLVPVGYGDGVPRRSGNHAEVLVGDRRRPVRGRVCMDQLLVDLEGEEHRPGEDVELFGDGHDGGPTAQDWAEASDTISYEIVTRIGSGRMPRRYVDSETDPGATA